MRYFLLSSSILILFGCSSPYKSLKNTTGNFSDIAKHRPAFTSALYKTEVNVIGKYLSGILIIKKMPDSSTRVVFTNEMGLTFFDFGFAADGGFHVFSIVKQMDKKAVIKTLRKDFELILMEHLDSNNMIVKKKNNLLYYTFPQTKGYNYYITDSTSRQLIGMERASKRKTIVYAVMKKYVDGVPDTIGISHNTFDFTIGLKKMDNK